MKELQSPLTSSHDNNENLKKLSVIIPAYNVEKSLIKCVESVVNQTYKNIEIIIVDDGSKDLTPQICDELKNKYENIIVIHQENKGLCKTRETGFNASTGDYIAFVDSDDYIDVTAYEKAIKVLEENKCDIVQFGFYYVSPEGTITKELRKKPVTLTSKEDIFLYAASESVWNIWDEVYKRSLFENIEWLKISISEDLCTSFQLFGSAKKLVAMEDSFYYYVKNTASLTHQSFIDLKVQKEQLTAQNFIINFTEKNFPEFLPEVLWRCLKAIQYIAVSENISSNREGFDNYIQVMRDYYSRFINELEKLKKQGIKPEERPGLGGYLRYNIRKRFRMWLFIKFPVLSVMRFKISQKMKIRK